MSRRLLFQLFAPTVSWGDIAIGERRPSLGAPTKSAVLGLVAGALGYSRTDDGRHDALARRFSFGACVDSPGVLLVDYHTSQTASSVSLKAARKRRPIVNRADLLRYGGELHTILSTRDYLTDTLAIVALSDDQPSEPSLEAIAEALDRPHFSPYLGRRCSSPALPFAPVILESPSLLDALRQFSPTNEYRSIGDHLARSRRSRKRTFFWEGEDTEADVVVTRRDGLLSRSRWQFTERTMHRRDEEVRDVSLPA